VETSKRFDELPNGVIQGDANEGNIIVDHEENTVVSATVMLKSQVRFHLTSFSRLDI